MSDPIFTWRHMSGGGVWYGIVVEINGDWLFLDLRKDGEPDLTCEVSVSRWGLQAAQVGSILKLDTDAGGMSYDHIHAVHVGSSLLGHPPGSSPGSAGRPGRPCRD